jgi:hypothetical protein
MIKDIFAYFKYLTLSKEAKIEMNINLVKEKYWFQQLVINQPSTLKRIEEDKVMREYFSSRKMVRKLLRNKEERQRFKDFFNDK